MNLTNTKQKSNPMFSIIIPAYNSQDYLEKGVKSVINQTYDNLEIVLVDDGSKDNTLKICNKFAEIDNRVKVIHQENGGHTSARNTGLLNSTGEYVIFLDSDDWLDIDALEIFYKDICNKHPDIIVFSVCQNTNDSSKILPNLIPDGFYNLKSNKEILEKILMTPDGTFSFQKSLSGKVFRRSIVMEYQLKIPKDVLVGEDGACFVLSMLNSDTVSVISSKNYCCSIRENSVSHSFDKLAFERYVSLIEFYRNNINLSDNQFVEQLKRYAVAHLYTALQFVMRSDCSKKYLKDEFKKVLKNKFVKDAIKQAKFSKSARKMKVKQLILRYKLFFLVKPLSALTH